MSGSVVALRCRPAALLLVAAALVEVAAAQSECPRLQQEVLRGASCQPQSANPGQLYAAFNRANATSTAE